MAYKTADTIYNILWKLVESVGGTPRSGDSKRDLLAKYLRAIGGTPITGDTFYDILVKIVRIKGGVPKPGDNQWMLLVRWLLAEGECRRCGDSVHDLWRRILMLGESEPPVNGLLAGLTGYWKLDETSGTRVDSHANYDLSQTGSVSSAPAALNNGAAFFSSDLDFLANTSADLGTHSGSFSFSAWINPVVISEGMVFGKGEIFGSGWWQCRMVAGPFFALSSSDTDFSEERCVSDVVISAGQFYHVAAAYNGGTGMASIWVNGVKVEDAHLAAVDNVQAFLMSKDTTTVVDELAIWIGRALVDADVTFLLNGGVPLPYESFN